MTSHMWNLKYGIDDPIYKAETDQRHREEMWLPRGRARGRKEGIESLGLAEANYCIQDE